MNNIRFQFTEFFKECFIGVGQTEADILARDRQTLIKKGIQTVDLCGGFVPGCDIPGWMPLFCHLGAVCIHDATYAINRRRICFRDLGCCHNDSPLPIMNKDRLIEFPI